MFACLFSYIKQKEESLWKAYMHWQKKIASSFCSTVLEDVICTDSPIMPGSIFDYRYLPSVTASKQCCSSTSLPGWTDTWEKSIQEISQLFCSRTCNYSLQYLHGPFRREVWCNFWMIVWLILLSMFYLPILIAIILISIVSSEQKG